MLKIFAFLIECRIMIFKLLTGILLLFTANAALAQIGRGCLVDGVLYTENTTKGNRFFYRTPGNLSTNCEFIYTGTNNGNCRLYNGGDESLNSSYTLYNDSFGNDWMETTCPLDDYAWMLMVLIGGLSIFHLKNEAKQRKLACRLSFYFSSFSAQSF